MRNVRFHAKCDCTIWFSVREHYVQLALTVVGLFLYVLTAPSALAQANAKNVLIAASVEDLHGDSARDRNNIQK